MDIPIIWINFVVYVFQVMSLSSYVWMSLLYFLIKYKYFIKYYGNIVTQKVFTHLSTLFC